MKLNWAAWRCSGSSVRSVRRCACSSSCPRGFSPKKHAGSWTGELPVWWECVRVASHPRCIPCSRLAPGIPRMCSGSNTTNILTRTNWRWKWWQNSTVWSWIHGYLNITNKQLRLVFNNLYFTMSNSKMFAWGLFLLRCNNTE